MNVERGILDGGNPYGRTPALTPALAAEFAEIELRAEARDTTTGSIDGTPIPKLDQWTQQSYDDIDFLLTVVHALTAERDDLRAKLGKVREIVYRDKR